MCVLIGAGDRGVAGAVCQGQERRLRLSFWLDSIGLKGMKRSGQGLLDTPRVDWGLYIRILSDGKRASSERLKREGGL